MTDLRKDPVTGRWVIISTERRKRPTDFRLEPVYVMADPSCPFCEGHEHMTPRELLAHRVNGSGPNSPGWSLRVVPNQFPVLRVEGTLDRCVVWSDARVHAGESLTCCIRARGGLTVLAR